MRLHCNTNQTIQRLYNYTCCDMEILQVHVNHIRRKPINTVVLKK